MNGLLLLFLMLYLRFEAVVELHDRLHGEIMGDIHLQDSLVVIGNMTVGGTIAKVEELANVLQVCVDAGAKRVLIPAASVADLQTVPAD